MSLEEIRSQVIVDIEEDKLLLYSNLSKTFNEVSWSWESISYPVNFDLNNFQVMVKGIGSCNLVKFIDINNSKYLLAQCSEGNRILYKYSEVNKELIEISNNITNVY